MNGPAFRTSPRFAVALLIAAHAASAAAQSVVLQLSSAGPAAGAIVSSTPDVSCTSTCSLAVPQGDTVVLTATPAPGNRFDGWAGDCSGSDATCTVVMDGFKLAIASFRPSGDPFRVIHRFPRGGPDGRNPWRGSLLAYDGALFGMTPGGGGADEGTIFSELPDGSQHQILHVFLGGAADGRRPYDSLIAVGGVLFGLTEGGGASDAGTIFTIRPDGTGFAVVHSFAGGPADGSGPVGSLLESGGVLYGMTPEGGADYAGTIFKVNPDGTGYELLHSFAYYAEGGSPGGSLMAFDGDVYGLTSAGGPGECGTAFKVVPDGSGFRVLHAFAGGAADGAFPHGSLVVSRGQIYGMTPSGGAFSRGMIFNLGPDGNAFVVVRPFAGGPVDGAVPEGSLVDSDGVLYGATSYGGVRGLGTLFSVNPDGTGFEILHSFTGETPDGSLPPGSLTASGSVLYGMTPGGSDNGGTIFRINTDSSAYAVLHVFRGSAEASLPASSPVAFGTALYGVTSKGGAFDRGTVYRTSADGTDFVALHSFAEGGDVGWEPTSLVASSGAFYGTTSSGGSNGHGTIFRINADGSGLTVIHSFADAASDGYRPVGWLTQSGGVLYGVTSCGGASHSGTVFRINPDGSAFTVLHSFVPEGGDGARPSGSVVALGGDLYGMTQWGGPNNLGTIFRIDPDGGGLALLHTFGGSPWGFRLPRGSLLPLGGSLYGTTSEVGLEPGYTIPSTLFKINPDGSGFTVLHMFGGSPSDGDSARGSLTDAGGELYGLTPRGGASRLGVIYRVNPDGSGFETRYSFTSGDGLVPSYDCPLTARAGSLYGITNSGGPLGGGVIFRFDAEPPSVRRHLTRQSK